jgi:hypothetical protein
MSLRGELLLVGATFAISTGGCIAFDVALSPEAYPYSPVSTGQPHDKRVNLGNFPKSLPQAVSNMLSNVVVVNYNEPSPPPAILDKGNFALQSDYGSGLELNKNLYLSAGHILRNEKTGSKLPRLDRCSAVSVDTGNKSPTSFYISNSHSKQKDSSSVVHKSAVITTAKYGYRLRANKKVASYDPSNNSVPDVSLIYTNKKNDYRMSKPAKVTISTNAPRVGTKLFFANFQPTPVGQYRDPNENLLSEKDIKQKLNKPAIYGGIMLGHIVDDGDDLVVTGLRNYGSIRDRYERHGSSGGPVFTSTGKLIGMSVMMPSRNHVKLSLQELSQEYYHQNFVGVKPKSKLSYSLVQPISKKVISTMRTRLNQSPGCVNNRSK